MRTIHRRRLVSWISLFSLTLNLLQPFAWSLALPRVAQATESAPEPQVVEVVEVPVESPLPSELPTPTPEPTPTSEPSPSPSPTSSTPSEPSPLVPTVTTDEQDYGPTDRVMLVGHNFAPNTSYRLRIWSTDEPVSEFNTAVNADDAGIWQYAYGLDGIYRAQYFVNILDQSEQVLAQTTFADSRAVVAITVNGASHATINPGATLNLGLRVVTDWWWFHDDNWKSTRVKLGNNNDDAGWTCYDHSDFTAAGTHNLSLSLPAPTTLGTYDVRVVAYRDDTCSDGASGLRKLSSALSIVDTEPPTLTLLGPATLSHELGNSYVDPGATAWDAQSGDLTSQIIVTGVVDPLQTGVYTLTYQVSDAQGNAAIPQVRTITVVDTTAPSVVANGAPNGQLLATNNFDFTWDPATDFSPVSYRFHSSRQAAAVDGVLTTELWESGWLSSPTIHSSGAPDGVWYWQVQAVDAFGNLGAWSPIWTVSLDTIAPTVDILSPLTDILRGDQDIYGSVVDANPWRYYLVISDQVGHVVAGPGTVYEPTSFVDRLLFSLHTPALDDGTYTIRLEARDLAGNKGTNSIALQTVSIDNTAPTAQIVYSPAVPTNGVVTASLVPSEPVTVTNNAGESSYNFTDNGQFNFTFVDAAGNTGTATATVDWIDLVSPQISLNETPADALLTNQNTLTFGATTSEPVSSCTLNFSGNYLERTIASTLSDGSGMSQLLYADDAAVNYSLPFAFPFYGNGYHQLSVSTNALLRFDSSSDASYPGSVDLLRGRVAITPLWQDLVTQLSVQSTPDNVRFRWTGSGWATGGSLTSEAVLRNNGTVEFHYGSVYLPSRPVTAGLSAGNNVDYVLSSSNGQSIIGPVSYAYSPSLAASYPMAMVEDSPQSWTVTVPDLADGRYSYRVTCQDLVGNAGESASRTLIVDTQAPVLSSQTTFADWYDSPQTSFFTYTDENGIAESSTNPLSCVISTEGQNQTCRIDPVSVCDQAGNCNTEALTSNGANLDFTVPTIALTTNPAAPDAQNGWFKTQPELTLTVTDANPALTEYQWGGTTGAWLTYAAPFKPAAEGKAILYFRARDLSGKYSAIGSQQIQWDDTALSQAAFELAVSPNPTTADVATVTWKAATDLQGISKYEVEWRLGDTVYTDTVGGDILSHQINRLTEGDWKVTVRAFDGAGHSLEANIGLRVDRTAPSAPTLTLGARGEGTVALSWSFVEGADNYSLWYGTEPGNYIYGAKIGNLVVYTVSGLGAGTYYFAVKAHDAAGNVSGYSNEVNSGYVVGAPGTTPGQIAEGFAPAPEVLGATTTASPTPNPSPDLPESLGEVLGRSLSQWWLYPLLFVLGTILILWLARRSRRGDL